MHVPFKKKAKAVKKRKKDTAFPAKSSARKGGQKENTTYWESSSIVSAGLFIIFTALVITICFLGKKEKGPQVILNQPAQERIVAEFPFEYVSEIILQQKIRATRAQVPPVFQRSFATFEGFKKKISDLNSAIAKNQIEHENEDDAVFRTYLQQTVEDFITTSQLAIDPDAIIQVTAKVMPKERSILFENSLEVLKSIYEDGVYTTESNDGTNSQVTVIQLVDESGNANLPNARSLDNAMVALRVRINSLSADTMTARALFEIFRAGLKPNLVYSEKGTNQSIERAVKAIEPPILSYKSGDTLIEPGSIPNENDIERISAYRVAQAARGEESIFLNDLFIRRAGLTVILLIAVLLFIKQNARKISKRNHTIGITAFSILLNLLIIRLIMEVGDLLILNNSPSFALLPSTAPYALAPILIAALLGSGPAIVSALIISVLFGIGQENSIELSLVALLSGTVGSFISSNIRNRSKLVRAGLLAGSTAAIASAVIGLMNGMSFTIVGQQTIASLLVGLLTGVAAVGMLPIFEQLFKITTDITLLELTDFNHPLLRRMQVEAPGTYHHSLMVANLSENAAAEIGASPLTCRVCSFFHDIGKLVKPEYFVENQRGGINPHDSQNPSMSALVIKAHVKEGVELARQHKLPRVIIDVITQHHGTGLIQFFYYQAQKKQNIETRMPFPNAASGNKGGSKTTEGKKVDESTYRYDGPRPAFKESAIIFFADSVEAASRSLKKVSQPAIEELIDNIFNSRIQDGQLDKCPLTFMELEQIRRSFVYTLLNMLHSRVDYPKDNKDKTKNEEDSRQGISANDSLDESAKPTSKQPV